MARQSGWVDPKKPCIHPGRPKSPRDADEGKTWHCGDCDTSFVAYASTDTPFNEQPSGWREL